MKAVFVLLDSLNRNALKSYSDESNILTPNFKRFEERCITFDNHYVGSLPCIPARRDLHTGRINFLHRSWGPLEPFDDSFPEILKTNEIYSHIVTDHHHYFADGGATYHQRYSSWELVRGQAIDRWKAEVNPNTDFFQSAYHKVQQHRKNYMINRQYMIKEEDYCTPQVFYAAEEFLNKNKDEDNWLLQIECFDPHEPFHAPKRFRELYPTDYEGPILDWPIYARVKETANEISEIRANYASLVTMVDEYFGSLLNYFDEHDLWNDTALIVTTDHGFLLGEHDWWAKNRMPVYNEIARIPLMIYHPDFSSKGGSRRNNLTQTTDIMPTILDIFNLSVPKDVIGKSLLQLLESDRKIRDSLIFGYFGASCNITDGKHIYFRYPDKMIAEDLWEYTLMPTRMTSRFSIEELACATLSNPFSFSKGLKLLKLRPRVSENGEAIEVQGMSFEDTSSNLFDVLKDPKQQSPKNDPVIVNYLLEEMYQHLKLSDAPEEIFVRFKLKEK
ncbi:MAG: sulfatase [Paracoccaceae bacterium]|nr:sulfatase [Paracoccaceae bacterium]